VSQYFRLFCDAGRKNAAALAFYRRTCTVNLSSGYSLQPLLSLLAGTIDDVGEVVEFRTVAP
jgi:hypothetical protein